MKLRVALRLGRVSNLPTVWTNAMAGAALAGGAAPGAVALAALSLSFSYVAGMWLNDAFDADIDARARAGRPIPAGEAARTTVFAVGFALLAAGAALGFALGPAAGLCALALAAAVLLYDWLHKRTALSPLLMGATRFLAYGVGAASAAAFLGAERADRPLGDLFSGAAFWGAVGLFAYVVGLTYAAKQEAYDRIGAVWPLAVLAVPAALALHAGAQAPLALGVAIGMLAVFAHALRLLFRRARGDVPRAVVAMISGISLYDGAMIAATGDAPLALAAIACFALTLWLQRVAPGT